LPPKPLWAEGNGHVVSIRNKLSAPHVGTWGQNSIYLVCPRYSQRLRPQNPDEPFCDQKATKS
jgi:hypothetical protein